MPIEPTSFAHIRLTVKNIERSRAFYDAVLGLPIAFEAPPDADEVAREQLWFLFGGVIHQLGDALLGLRPVGSDTGDPLVKLMELLPCLRGEVDPARHERAAHFASNSA